MRQAAITLALGLALAAPGCTQERGFVSGGPEPDNLLDADDVAGGELYTGTVEGTDAVIAVAIDRGEVVAYACGGAESRSTHTHWFCGPRQGSGADIEFEEWRFTFVLEGDVLTGTITDPDGLAYAVRAEREGEDSRAALYANQVGGCSTGVIVMDDGSETRAQGAHCDEDTGVQTQVTPVRTVNEHLLEVDVERPDVGLLLTARVRPGT